MSGRKANLKEIKENTISKQVPKPKIGRIRRIFAAAGIAGALVLAGCGASRPAVDSNFKIDNTWKPQSAETPKTEDPFGDFWKEKVDEGALGWVDASFNAAIAGRRELPDKQAYRVALGIFILEIMPDYSNNQLSVFVSSPSQKKTSSFTHGPGEQVKRLPPGHPFHNASTDYLPLPQTEDSGEPRVVTETSQKLEWKFPMGDKSPSFPTQLIDTLPISGKNLYLISTGSRDMGAGKRITFLMYDDEAYVSVLIVDYGREGVVPKFFSGSYDLAPYIRDTVRSNPGIGISKHPLNTEYAILSEENEDLFGFSFAFSAKNPMDALSVFTWFKSEDEGVVNGKFHMHKNSLLSPDPKTRLVGAANAGSVSQIQKLLGEGVDINAKSHDGFTPLLAAVAKGRLDTIELLLAKGADPSIGCEEKGNNALLQAAAMGKLEVAQRILKHDKSLLESRNKGGQTAFILAASSGNVELARFLVSEGAKAKVSDKEGFTPLMAAISGPHYGMAEYLVEELKVDLEARNKADLTALMGTAVTGDAKMAKYLLKQGADQRAATDSDGGNTLMLASQEGNLEVVKALVEHDNSLIEVKSKSGGTAVMFAISHDRWEVADYLLEHGADINAYTLHGETALSAMVESQDAEGIDYLLEHGADPNAGGNLPMFLSIVRGNLELLKKFEAHGGNLYVGGTSQSPTTLLDTAAYAGNLRVVKYLVEEKEMSAATGKESSYNGDLEEGVLTPLTSACTHPEPNLEVLEYLLKHKAKVNMRDGTGELPLTKAAFHGNVDAIKLLVKHRAKVNARNREGKTPLEICKENGHEEAAGYLKSKGAR